MKTTFTLILLSICFAAGAQELEHYYAKPWKVGKTNIINGHSITKVDNAGAPFITYYTVTQLQSEMKVRSEKEMWKKGILDTLISQSNKQAAGGFIEVYLQSITIEAADPKWVTVIIQDSSGNELYRDTPESRVADGNANGYWYSYVMFQIPVSLPKYFIVYCIYSMSEEPKYKYIVNQ